MALKSIDPTKTETWKALLSHYELIKGKHMKDWFQEDRDRADQMTIHWDDFYFDYSKNRINSNTMSLFNDLAKELHLKEAIQEYFGGAIINETEQRAVLHTALRASEKSEVFVDGINVVPKIYEVKQKIKGFTNDVLEGVACGYTGQSFTDIVNIGIGGSDLGPAMVVDALKFYKNHLKTHFVNNVDGDHVHEILKHLNPETTLFIIVSKSFNTQETMANAETIKAWFLENASESAIEKHFVAVSTNIEKVTTFGISEANIFPMWDWVGGRFSLWSAVGLSISLSLGYENFEKLLQGAQKMDTHFKTADFDQNIPVIMAFISIWYNNFFNAQSEAVIPYAQYLNQISSYLQQSVMESNGKCVMRNGETVDFQTGNIIWGAPGTNSQHAFFQLMHQGTKLIPADFIGFATSLHGDKEHQFKLMSNFIAQTEALLNGKTKAQVLKELENSKLSPETIQKIIPYKVFEGNKPTNTILIKKLTPESLGKLIAMYEHKIFVQGVFWNIYSFDQFGVELGKQLADTILKEIKNSSFANHDASTQNLINFFKKLTN
jgi:glucose-6-phosphate isomerase